MEASNLWTVLERGALVSIAEAKERNAESVSKATM